MKKVLLLMAILLFLTGCTTLVTIDVEHQEPPPPRYMGVIVNDTRRPITVRILESTGRRYETIRTVSLSAGQTSENIWLYEGTYRFEATSSRRSRYSQTISRYSIPRRGRERYAGRTYDWTVVFR